MPAYEVEVLPPARRDLRRLDNQVRKTSIDLMRALASDPRPTGVSAIKGHRPYLRDARMVTVARIQHRREVYRGLDL